MSAASATLLAERKAELAALVADNERTFAALRGRPMQPPSRASDLASPIFGLMTALFAGAYAADTTAAVPAPSWASAALMNEPPRTGRTAIDAPPETIALATLEGHAARIEPPAPAPPPEPPRAIWEGAHAALAGVDLRPCRPGRAEIVEVTFAYDGKVHDVALPAAWRSTAIGACVRDRLSAVRAPAGQSSRPVLLWVR